MITQIEIIGPVIYISLSFIIVLSLIVYYFRRRMNYICPVCSRKATYIAGLGKLKCSLNHVWDMNDVG